MPIHDSMVKPYMKNAHVRASLVSMSAAFAARAATQNAMSAVMAAGPMRRPRSQYTLSGTVSPHTAPVRASIHPA
jgi:hypothetical protein